ncbi:uncharacterized protein LOC127870050 [Dreissena polymorpha]|nr:uncharacterized protein LOC127870050 [Dreissena polymorpha]
MKAFQFNAIVFWLLLMLPIASATNIRLVGGRTPYSGRLEVEHGGQWGTVCDDEFTVTSAKVVCRMLGFADTGVSEVLLPSVYGPGTGIIMLDSLNCNGYEEDVANCSHDSWQSTDCSHKEDVGVNCHTKVQLATGSATHDGQVEVNISGIWEPICAENFTLSEAKVVCGMMGFSFNGAQLTSSHSYRNTFSPISYSCHGAEKDISLCVRRNTSTCFLSSAASINCRTPIRLVNGTSSQSGRVEIEYRGRWGTICDDGFDDLEAKVICNMLGFSTNDSKALGGSYYGEGTGDIVVDEMRCIGNENDISECKSSDWMSPSNCNHIEDASVECKTEVRLSDGPTRYAGRLEIQNNSVWETVCSDLVDNKTAVVVCRMLGFEGGNITVYYDGRFKNGSGSMKSHGYDCEGNETDIANCKSTETIVSCSTRLSSAFNCYSYTPIRLLNGTTMFNGRVEIYVRENAANGYWREMCYDKFTIQDAMVLCKMIGHPNVHPRTFNAYSQYNSNGRFSAIISIGCTGNETDISGCTPSNQWTLTSCSTSNRAAINCAQNSTVKVADGPSIKAGRVEILYNGTWLGICRQRLINYNYYDITAHDINIICKHLGYNQSGYLISEVQPRSKIVVRNLDCSDTEGDISDCKSDTWGVEYPCDQAAIVCNSSVRLVNGSSERSGRVEVLHQGRWGTICADEFTNREADVVCRKAGIRLWNASALDDSPFGFGNHGYLLKNVSCKSSEHDIGECQSFPWNETSCRDGNVATVFCRVLETPIRLLGGKTSFDGRVELHFKNDWKQICYQGYNGKISTDVLCRLLEYNFSRDATYTNNYDYSNSLNSLLRDLQCVGNESDISLCPSSDWGYTYCNYYGLTINCLSPISIDGSFTKHRGYVRVQKNGRSGYLCADNLTAETQAVMCKMLFNFTRVYEVVKEPYFKPGFATNILVDNILCSGTEEDYQMCPSSNWDYNTKCKNPALIRCNTPVRLKDQTNMYTGTVEVYLNKTWSNICFDPMRKDEHATMFCRMLGYNYGLANARNVTAYIKSNLNLTCNAYTEDIDKCVSIKESFCDSILHITCPSLIQLQNGRTNYMGQLTIRIGDSLRSVSALQDEETIQTVCRLMRFNFTGNYQVWSEEFLRKKNTYDNEMFSKLKCNGDETDIIECLNSTVYSTPTYTSGTGINCQTPIRLDNGNSYLSGKLEINVNKTWLPVCSDRFSSNDAYVICRMLGHKHVRNATIMLEATSGSFADGAFVCNGKEDDISQCTGYTGKTVASCSSQQAIAINCQTSVRIADGPSSTKGRVEVFYNGNWGPVCRSAIGTNEANVICRSAGFRYTYGHVQDRFKYSNKTFNKYMISGLVCTGYEETITECSANEWWNNTCFDAPLELECRTSITLQPGVSKYYGWIQLNFQDPYTTTKYGSLCGSGFSSEDADVVCTLIGAPTFGNATVYPKNKFGSHQSFVIEQVNCSGREHDLQECQSKPWSENFHTCNSSYTTVAVNCRPDTPTRLQGNDLTKGLVEVFFDGTWYTMCGSYFNFKEAAVVCNKLGYKIGTPDIQYSSRNALIYGMTCNGDETDISQCQFTLHPSECCTYPWTVGRCSSSSSDSEYTQRAGVKCSNNRVRLVSNVNRHQGRVEFQYFGVWGTVCNTMFDQNDASVICRLAGYEYSSNITIHRNTKYGYGQGNLIVEDLQCNGTETDIDECASYPWKENSAQPPCNSHNLDVGVNCRPVTPMRLVGGTNYSGRVEIEYEGVCGTICDRNFDENDAKVICRMKGLNTKSVIVRKNVFNETGNGRILISDLNCEGNEPDISECSVGYTWGTPYSLCTHNEDVAVQCNTPVRVSEGLTFYSGMVEVYINHGWKRVCKDNFTMDDAIAICNQAGKRDNYHGNISIHNQDFVKILPEPTTLGGFGCHGDERDLYECGFGQWTESEKYCPSGENIAVNCRAQTPVRLMEGFHEATSNGKHKPIQGRVEIQYRRFDQSLQKYVDDHWGTICDDQFGDEDASVLCTMMGYSIGKVYHPETEYALLGNETIILDDLQCLGVEEDVSECKAREWGTHDCVHDEDVAINCNYQDNIDPCDKENYKRLPNLEIRLVKFETKSNPISDNKLSLNWYYVGNNTLPDKEPPMNRCATFYPVYSKDTNAVPAFEDKIKYFKAEQAGDSNITYNVQAKNCGGYFVYRLGPTLTENSGYCFGIGSEIPPSSFVAGSVGVVYGNTSTSIWFKCKFDPDQTQNLYYQVEWHVIGNSEHVTTKQYCSQSDMSPCYLTHKDLEDMNIGMGTNITCAVRAFNEPNSQPGQLSLMSDPFFLGITVLTPRISLHRGEYKSVEMKLSVPIVCDNVRPSNNIACGVNMDYFTPDYGTCPNAEGNFPGGCSVAVTNKSYGTTITVNVSAAETGQYGVAGKFTLFLQIPRTRGVAFFSVSYKLPAIEVEVLPEMNRQWRGKLCAARNDPHMYTFDGRSYEHHAEEGDYILYSHSLYKQVEIQHRIVNCTDDSPAKCNCGVAVRAGRDIYVINVCDRYIDIGYRQCWDKALTVKKENDYTYTIYLPYGTAVRARIDSAPFMGEQGGRVLDISVNPSIQDSSGKSTGLCGSLNGNSSDDFDNESQFIKQWKVPRNASLFTNDSYHKEFEPWIFPTCTCKKTTGGNGAYSCDRSIAGCTRGTLAGYHSCGELIESRPVRSTSIKSRKPEIKIPVLHQRFHVRNRRSTGVWTDDKARAHCEHELKAIQDMCNKIPDTHTNVSLENCVLDIMITNSSFWLAMSRQSMLQTCQNEIQRNNTVIKVLIERAENKNITSTGEAETHTSLTTDAPQTLAELNILKEILKTSEHIEEIFCMNNCSGNGTCVNGTCQCNSGFGAVDCSIDLKKPPIISGILDEGLCDQNNTDCSQIVVFGGEFTSSNLTCRLNIFYFDIHGTPHNDSGIEVPGHAETIVETICPLRGLRQRRSIADRFVVGFHVSVSNDGENYDDHKQGLAYIYNSQCQTYGYAKDSQWIYTFSLKDGFCFIEGQCYYNGTFHISQKMICDPLANQTSWTPYTRDCIQTDLCKTKRNSVCEVMNNTVQCSCARGYSQNESDSNDCAEISLTTIVPDEVYDGRHSHVVVEVKLDYIFPQGLTLNASTTYGRYELELSTKLTEYYKDLLGEQFSKVVITAIKIGSLIVEHWVFYVQNEHNPVNVYDALTRHSERPLGIFDQTVHVLNVSIVNNEGCASPMACSKKNNSLCEVWDGVTRCSCIRGYIESKSTPSTCVENTQGIIVPDENALSDDAHGVLQVEIKLGYSLPHYNSLNTSNTYDIYVKELNTSLTKFYKDEIGHWLSKVVIRDIRTGSLYVDHFVVYQKREHILSDVIYAVLKLAESGLVIYGKTYNVTNAFIGKDKVPLHDNTEEKKSAKCRVYTSIHPCNDDEQCEVDDSVVRCVKKKTTQELFIIVSAAVGGALFLIIVVLVVVLCKKKAKKPMEMDHLESKAHDNTYQDISAREMSVLKDDVHKTPRANLSGSKLAFEESQAKL